MPPDISISEERFNELSNQAYVLEFVANSMLTTYTTPQLGSNLWIAHHAPLLVKHSEGPIPNHLIDVADSRIMMAQEFNSRLESGRVSSVDHANILEGLLAFEDPAIVQAAQDTMLAFQEATNPREVPGYLSAGNNALAFTIQGYPETEDKRVLKIGFNREREESGCDQASYANLCRWLGLMAGKGVAGLEQPVAFSAEKPISITKLVPGVELYEIAQFKNKPQPSEESLLRFAQAFYESIVRRITIDVHGRDILYDVATDQLTIIDHNQFSKTYGLMALRPNRVAQLLTQTFKASFGYEFDDIGFERLLNEFAAQGEYDLQVS